MNSPPFLPFSEEMPEEFSPEILDIFFMQVALNEALTAWHEEEVPVGAVLVRDGKILARNHNRVRQKNNPLAHGELLVFESASQIIGDWRLGNCTLYSTKEPCPMCSGACVMSRIPRVVFGVHDEKMGCLGGNLRCDFSKFEGFNHRFSVQGGVLAEKSAEILQKFFQKKRQNSQNFS